MTVAPKRLNIAATVLFPEPIPPVRPTTTIRPAFCSLGMGLSQAGPNPEVYPQWNAERGRTLHLFSGHPLGDVQLGFGHLEQQLIMDLKNHPGLQPFQLQTSENGDHRNLDQVCSRSLNRRVHCQPLPELPSRLVGGLELRDRPSASPGRTDDAEFSGVLDRPVDKCLDPAIDLEIALDVQGSLLLWHIEFRGQTKGTHPVDDAEIDHLCPSPHLRRHLLRLYPEDLGCSAAVHI